MTPGKLKRLQMLANGEWPETSIRDRWDAARELYEYYTAQRGMKAAGNEKLTMSSRAPNTEAAGPCESTDSHVVPGQT